MPLLDKPELLQLVVSSVQRSGWQALYLSQEHPFRLILYRDDESYRVRIYTWNLTHGGGAARPAHEYRIQMTGVDRFEPEPDGKTLILGWWQDAGVFAAFDIRRHLGRLGRSPSVQVREEYLRQALADRFAVCPKENQELALAFVPDFLVEYIRNLESLHTFGESQSDLDVLAEVARSPEAVEEHLISGVTEPRREAVYNVRKRLRAASFQSRVLFAYEHRCAFCGVQLELVEAGHIVPVASPGSTDATSNGLALCGLHHNAYDNALIATRADYRVLVNRTKIQQLQERARDGGRREFLAMLRASIFLPQSIADRPGVHYVQIANTLRGWDNVETDVLNRIS